MTQASTKFMVVCAFSALVLAVVGISPLSLYSDNSSGACVTFWGYQTDCAKRTYDLELKDVMCPAAYRQIQTAAAFMIIGIAASAGSLVFAGLHYTGKLGSNFLFYGVLFSATAHLISVALAWSAFATKLCDQTSFEMRGGYRFGASFGLDVACLSIAFVGALCHAIAAIPDEKKKDSTEPQA